MTDRLKALSDKINAQCKDAEERLRQTNVRLGLTLTMRPIGEPLVLAPLSKPPYSSTSVTINDSHPIGAAPTASDEVRGVEVPSKILKNSPAIKASHPIGAAHTATDEVCGVERLRPIDAVNSAEGEWRKIKIGIHSCAALSVTPKDVSPGEIEITPQVGEEYTVANSDVIYNEGQQKVQGVTDGFMPFGDKFQVTDVRRPLMAVSDIRDNGNTIIYPKQYGDWIVNDQTGAATQLYFENGTSNLDASFFTRQS